MNVERVERFDLRETNDHRLVKFFLCIAVFVCVFSDRAGH